MSATEKHETWPRDEDIPAESEPEPEVDHYPPADEEPPPLEYEPETAHAAPQRSKRKTVPPRDSAVGNRLRVVIAALHGYPGSEGLLIAQSIRADLKVLSQLDEVQLGVLEILEHTAGVLAVGNLDLQRLPVLSVYSTAVQREWGAIRALIKPGSAAPMTEWQALREWVQRQANIRAVSALLELHEQQASSADLVAAHKEVVAEPPTARKALSAGTPVRTAREVAVDAEAAARSTPSVRYSSGLRTLDKALTGKGDPVGFVAPGEQVIIAAATGTGKSSFSYGLVGAMTQDLVNSGFEKSYLVWLHTEEESSDKLRAAELLPGMRLHHLAEQVVIDAVGTSRQRVVEVLYTLTQEAERWSRETGRAITDRLPRVMILDYLQSLSSERAVDPVAESITTSELLLRGVQAWNFGEMAKWGGISYQEFTGSPVPIGMEHHRVAVVAFAQLVKQDDKVGSYRAGSKDYQLSEFTVEDPRPEPVWTDPKGGKWAWEVCEGDARIVRKNEIAGSAKVLNNATVVLVLHRSRPTNNPAKLGDDGRMHLIDRRARVLLDKTRNGSQDGMTFVPLEFDVDEHGFRARYVDVHAQAAIERGIFTPHPCWRRSGDPILPKRPRLAPLAGVRY